MKKLKNFIRSFWFHIWAGFPKCTNQEILNRYNICIECDKFYKEKQQCLVCGCNLSTKKIFMNKLAWSDQECPIGKWNKITRKSQWKQK